MFNQSRKNIIIAMVLLMGLVVILKLFSLQVLDSKYSIMADEQGKFRKVIYPDRGILFDRKGKAILRNTIIYDLMVTPSKVRGINMDTATLCRILEIDTAEFRKRLLTGIIKNTSIRPSIFEASLPTDKVARLNESMYKFVPAFYLQERPVRDYPYDAAGNIIGYLSEVSPAFLEAHADEGYLSGDYAGRTGLERSYEKVLMGQRGIEYWKRDNRNRLTDRLEDGRFDTAAIPGSNLHMSLDIDLQKLGEYLMQNKVGAVVAIDPRTGGVLSMVSSPTYKPSLLSGAERRKHFAEILLDPRLPMLNRSINAYYQPGSTFKTLQALVALHEGVVTPTTHFLCTGAFYGCGRPMKCLDPGYFKLQEAITWSCNTYFANIMQRAINNPKYGSVDSALKVWDNYMYAVGLGHKLGIDMPSEKGGNIPTPATYNRIYGEKRWNFCTFKSVSIGQGEVDVTPLQMANVMAYIANKGWFITPHMIDSIDGGDKYGLLDSFKMRHIPMDIPDSVFNAVHDGMQGVMDRGTGFSARVPGIVVCGKTGTVENYYKGVKQRDHAFFAAFAPRDNPQIAIAVICENAGFGSTSAAPIASLMIEQYLKDSIEGKERKARVETISKMNLMPKRIVDAIKERDSLQMARRIEREKAILEKAKDSAVRAEKKKDTLKTSAMHKQPVGSIPDRGRSNDLKSGNLIYAILPEEVKMIFQNNSSPKTN
ncbi:MAG: penicillin-binding protein 2 [Ginsengibacter sp.]